ncbi:MAG: hypothetical protein Q9219_005392 [cf. Caloplaca sp. 3 TL-2023]
MDKVDLSVHFRGFWLSHSSCILNPQRCTKSAPISLPEWLLRLIGDMLRLCTMWRSSSTTTVGSQSTHPEPVLTQEVTQQKRGTHQRSKLKLLVPSVGVFFTPLFLEEAFNFQDERRRISSRRFVPPSFNDIRLILNSAQLLSLVRNESIQLVTFDGDVTLYEDGASLSDENPVIPRILRLLREGIHVGIVTAAGYTDASRYYERLHGLLDAVANAVTDREVEDPKVIILGGESNYLFEFDFHSESFLTHVPRETWMLDEMRTWQEEDIQALLDEAEGALRECIGNMQLSAEILRKDRAVGIIPAVGPGKQNFTREQLEETVLVTQQILDLSDPGKKIPFCAFNGSLILFLGTPLASSLIDL